MTLKLLKKKRVLIPLAVILMLIAAYAKRLQSEKEVKVGQLQGNGTSETSGIGASSIHKDIYYIHNDSGDSARFTAINPRGEVKGTYYFKGEASEPLGVHDCEDLAVGPGPVKDKSYIYLGDIGDNSAQRRYLVVYRFEEPAIDTAKAAQPVKATPLYVRYPDGPHDAETMMVDPIEKLLYIVTKRRNTIFIFTTPLTYKAGDTVTLEKRATVKFAGLPPFKWITGGSISKDGRQILLKNYEHVYYWKRGDDETVWQAMTRKPRKLYYKQEKQGEAICFNNDGSGYYTVSEGFAAPIYYYRAP